MKSVRKSDPRANSINYNFIRSTRPSSQISVDGSETKKRFTNEQKFNIILHPQKESKKVNMNKTMVETSFVGILAKARDEHSMEKLKSNRNKTPNMTPQPSTRVQTARTSFLTNNKI